MKKKDTELNRLSLTNKTLDESMRANREFFNQERKQLEDKLKVKHESYDLSH